MTRSRSAILGSMMALLSGCCAAAEGPPGPGASGDVERGAEELVRMGRTLVRTHRFPPSYAEARGRLAEEIASWPPAVTAAAARRVLLRPRTGYMLKQRVTDALVDCGALGHEFAGELIEYVRDENEREGARGHVMAVLLAGRLKDVAPRDELVQLTKDMIASGPQYVRTKALIFSFELDEPSVIREVVRVAQVAQETDESCIWGPALASLRRCRAIPPDLREAVEELRRRARRQREEPGHRGESEPSASSGSEPEKPGVGAPPSEGGAEAPQGGTGEAIDRASDSASHNDLTVDDSVPADEVGIEASPSAEKGAASQGHGIMLYVAAGLACAVAFVAAVVARRLTKGKRDRH